MHQKQLFLLLLKPSLSSATVMFAVALLYTALSLWAFLTNNALLTTYFNESGAATNPIGFSWQAVWGSFINMLSQFVNYEMLLFLAAAFVSMGVYTFLQGGSELVTSAERVYQDAHERDKKARGQLVLRDFITITIRAIGLAAWVIYTAYFVNTILPYTTALYRYAADKLFTDLSWVYIFVAFAVFFFALHLHLVLLRLMLLRPRVFGGEREISNILST